jgi:hydrogenase-4 transcriptional activator
MIATDDLLRVYLRGVMGASGARAVSLFVPPGMGGPPDAILIHEGEGPAIPELASVGKATALRESAGSSAHDADPFATEPIREVASSDPDGLLVTLTVSPDDLQVSRPKSRRRRSDLEPAKQFGRITEVWIGLLGVAHDAEGISESLQPLLQMAGVLASHARDVSEILGDPLTGLPGRIEFERRLGHALSDAKSAAQPSMLLLINPDDFGTINETFGPERGDEVVRLVGRRLRDRLRTSDMVARYGGAIFVALIDGVNEETGTLVGQKILDALSEVLSLDDSFKLTVSAGAVCVGPDNHPERAEDLVRRAEQALRVAKRAGGGCLRFWDPAHESDSSGELDELSGVFTGNPSKDYRNMKLLSRTVTAIAGSADFNELTSVVAARINSTLRADRVALIDWAEDGGLQVISAVESSGAAPETLSSSTLQEDEGLVAVLDEVRKEGRSVTSVTDAGEHRRVVFGVPLVAGDACLGTLYVDGREGRIALDSSDVGFLQALGSQLALALDRARLSQVEMEWREAERQHLQAEIDELRQVFQKAELVCESSQMTALMATARRVAQTDATVLICGESGTGKELVSRTIHDLGPRRDKPLVVVDCTSIPVTLIESELFGHERGAYTGAQDRKAGRLKEADQGTVILDEIGELPLEVQGKLLRFVQEKQLTPVGGNRVVEVDARVVAATNRNLEDEVREGRFREDLFHRLNVIRLDVPPLRSRPKDILSLTEFFLRQFSAQYQKGKPRRLSQSAEASVLEYAWPGNVRELRNRLMQAVILSGTEQIGPEQLGLVEGAAPGGQAARVLETPEVGLGKSFDLPAPSPAEPVSDDDVWGALETALAAAVSVAVEEKKADLPPLYRWLTEDMVVNASEAANHVLTRGADILGIPEATFRRKLHKANDRKENGLAGRSQLWSAVSPLLPGLVRAPHPAGEDLLRQARDILLAHVIRCAPNSRATGAALMGVTDPTFRRWAKDLETALAGAVGQTNG